jgi:glycosyltransferase involved in cell wall biosynthesis
LKILFFNWRDITHPQAGGCELHLHEIAKRLAKKGHDVTLFCGAYENSKKKENVDGIEIIRKGGKFSVYIYAFVEYITNFKKKDFDIIIDDINGVPFFTPLYTNKPKVAIIHHMVKDIFSKELPIAFRPLGYFAEWLIPIIYRKTTFVTVSDSSKREMIDAGISPEQINVIHNGISNKYISNLNIKTENPTLLYIGRLKEYKQIDHLIKSIDLIKTNFPTVTLSIAGSGDKEKELIKLVETLNLKNNVLFHGFIDEKNKIELFQKSWIFINPSLKEGWGLTVIEANACGTPAIAYNVEGLRDSIQDYNNGLLVNSINYHDLSKKIIELLEDNDLRKKISYQAIKWSENFNWDISTDKFLNLLINVFKHQ